MGKAQDFTVIGLYDARYSEILVAGVVAGRVAVQNAQPRAGGYERVYYHVEAATATLAEQHVVREVEIS